MPETITVVISSNGFSVTLTFPFPPGGLWEARKRIEEAMKAAQ